MTIQTYVRVEVFTPCGSCKNRRSLGRLLITVNIVPSSPILVALMMEALSSYEMSVLQKPHGVTSQKTAFFDDMN
jgi:hypothetical protein